MTLYPNQQAIANLSRIIANTEVRYERASILAKYLVHLIWLFPLIVILFTLLLSRFSGGFGKAQIIMLAIMLPLSIAAGVIIYKSVGAAYDHFGENTATLSPSGQLTIDEYGISYRYLNPENDGSSTVLSIGRNEITRIDKLQTAAYFTVNGNVRVVKIDRFGNAVSTTYRRSLRIFEVFEPDLATVLRQYRYI